MFNFRVRKLIRQVIHRPRLRDTIYRPRLRETIYTMPVPASIALVADTHNHPVDDVLESIRRHKPDLICIAGDFVYARLPEHGLKMDESPYAIELLKECRAMAPTFVSIGNHEWMLNKEDLDMVLSTGITLLNNNYIRYKDMVIGGLSSASYMAYQAYCTNFPKESLGPDTIYPLLKPRSQVILNCEPDVSWLDEFCSQSGYKILLCHHPEYYPRYLKDMEIDLILSGHAHGGQIRIMGQGLYAPGQGLLPRLTSGLEDHRLVISRGLANNTIIPRLWNPREIVYIRKG